jgi:hypothetical protein
MAKTTDVVQQLHDARKQRDSLAGSIPRLKVEAENTAFTRRELTERLELKEGDALIGKVTDSELATARAKAEAATVEARKAAASLREAEDNVARLNDAIARLMPEVVAVRGAFYRQRQIELTEQVRAKFYELIALNDALYQNFCDAEAEFPYAPSRTGSRPYPPAAGLIDLSWHELRHNPYAQEGGRFGGWCKRVDQFIDPQPIPAPVRATTPTARTRTRDRSARWQPLPAGEVS